MLLKIRFSDTGRCAVASACLGLLFQNSLSALTLEQALERAEAQSPRLEILHERQLAAEAAIGSAGTLPDPKLQLTYFGESVETRTGPQEAIYAFNQTVPWVPKLRTRKTLASRHAEAVAYDYAGGHERLLREVTNVYVELAYLQKAIESTEANLSLIADTYSIVEEQVKAGASLNSLLRLEVDRERVRDHLELLKQQAIRQRASLAALLNMEDSELNQSFFFPERAIPAAEHENLQKQLDKTNPDLLALRQRILGSEEQLQLSRLNRYPDFTFGLTYIQVGNEGMASDAGKDPWALTFAVNLPIWEGKNRAEIRAASANQRAVEQLYREQQLKLKAELTALLSQVSDSAQRSDRYREMLIPLAEQALENSRSAYEGNQISVLELIDSERALLELNLTYWRAVANVLQAEASINALIGNAYSQKNFQ